jgi:hypothetical protein
MIPQVEKNTNLYSGYQKLFNRHSWHEDYNEQIKGKKEQELLSTKGAKKGKKVRCANQPQFIGYLQYSGLIAFSGNSTARLEAISPFRR